MQRKVSNGTRQSSSAKSSASLWAPLARFIDWEAELGEKAEAHGPAAHFAYEFVRFVQKVPDYATLRYSKKREEDLGQASLQLEREKARCERLMGTCEEVVLAKNLPFVATPEIAARYDKLLAMEEGSLSGPAIAARRAPAGAAASASR